MIKIFKMAATTKTSDFVKKVLVKDELLYNYSRQMECPWPFYVHASLIKKLEKRLNKIFPRDGWEMNEKILKVGHRCFDMYQIVILHGAVAQLTMLKDLIKYSQCSFPLEEHPTLFIAAPYVNFMEKFIRDHQLEPFIIKIVEMIGISTEDVPIIVVTFKKNVNKKLNVIEEFRCIFIDMNTNYFYMAFCFPWERASILRKCHMHDNVGLLLPIILQHLGTINYKNELNIMDLLSLRLALYDVSDNFQSNFIKSEIDFLVKRELTKTVKNNHFDLEQYLIDKNCCYNQLLCSYLIYEFQDYFKAVNYEPTNYRTCVTNTIQLKSESDVLDTIRNQFNVNYYIDGIGFDRMSSSLFFGLIQCDNILQIDLDTNYEWIKDEPKINRYVEVSERRGILVNFYGENTYKLADDCLAELKRLEFSQIRLVIYCRLTDYKILDNLVVEEIYFNGIRIDTDMLKQLHQCTTKTHLWMKKCSIENNWQTWELLNNLVGLQNLHDITIIEDERMWEYIFEFIIKDLYRRNTKEFLFKLKDIRVNLKGSRVNYIYLDKFKFTFDEQMSKLEIRHAESNNIVDLFYVKFGLEPEENFDLEFYQ